MKVGDLISMRGHPHSPGWWHTIGIVINVDTIEKGGYAIVVFPIHGEQCVYPDKAEIINEAR